MSPLFLSLFSVPNCVGSSYLVLLCVGGGPGDDPPGGLSVQAHAARSGHSRGHHHPPPPNSHFLFLWCSCACVRPLAWLCVVCGSLPSSIGAQQLGGSSTHTFTHNIGISTLKRNTSGRDKTKSTRQTGRSPSKHHHRSPIDRCREERGNFHDAPRGGKRTQEDDLALEGGHCIGIHHHHHHHHHHSLDSSLPPHDEANHLLPHAPPPP